MLCRVEAGGRGVEVLCIHKQLLLVAKVSDSEKNASFGRLARKGRHQYEGINGDIISVVPWRVPEGLNVDRKRKKQKQGGK